MKYCWYEKSPGWLRASEIFSFIGALCLWFYWAIRDIPYESNMLVIYFVFCGLVFYWISLGLLCAVLKARKYSVNSSGLVVQYPLGHTHVYDWNELSEVALCKVRFVPRDKRYYRQAIRCVVGTERNGPKHAKYAYEQWTTEIYDAKHWKSVITIEYSEDRFCEFASICPLEIIDYRDLT